MAKVRFPWLGNKSGEPRLPGAGKLHRAQQVTGTSYGTLGALMKTLKPQGLKSLKVKFK